MPAGSISVIAKYPFAGNWPEQGYTKTLDPWLNPGFRSYRRQFYKAFVEFMRRGKGQQYRVDGAFVWSVGSFDVFGVHPVSSSSQGTSADPEIIKVINQLNMQVNGQYKGNR